MTASTETKVTKKKGPIRFEAIIPLSIIVLLVGLYSHFYLNLHAKGLIEWTLSSIHGAEVNVQSVRIRVFSGKFELNKLEITNKKKPEENILSIGYMVFHFSWDAALRAKIVVDESSIKEIGFFTKRRKAGVIFPPAKRSEALIELEQQALSETQTRLAGNALGDLANIIGGTDINDQLDSIRGELKSENMIKELEDQLGIKEKEWKERTRSITNKEELKEIENTVKTFKFDNKNPVKSVQTASKLIKDVNDKVKEVEEGTKVLKSDLSYFDQGLRNIPQMVKDDIKDVEGRFKIPNIDLKDMSLALFAGYAGLNQADVQKYIMLAKEYMPPPKSERQKRQEQTAIVPRKRGEGKTFIFPITVSYPTFWLKKAEITSTSDDNPFSGDFSGTLNNVTTHPSFVKIPAILDLKGHMPHKKLEGMNVKLTIDHTTDNPKQEILFAIDKFPIGELKLSDSSSLKFYLQNPEGKASLRAWASEEAVNVDMNATLQNYSALVDASNKHVQDILTGVIDGIKTVNINSQTRGNFGNLKTTMSSNLGSELAKGVKREVEAKITEAKNKVKNLVESRIAEQKAKLEEHYATVKGYVTSNLDKFQKEIDTFKKSSLSDIEKQKDGQKDKVEEKAKDLLKDLKKKIKL